MPHLRITCFNNFQATLDGHLIIDFRSAKGRALLVYLAVNQDYPHQRQRLAGLLWPDESDDRARRNLSQTLLEVRRAIGDAGDATPGFLIATAQTLTFNPASDHWVDVTAFTSQLAAVQQHHHAQLATCERCTAQLAQATALYRGAFLADFVVPESDLFENWLTTLREQLHQQAVAAFTSLSTCYQAQGDLAQAQQTVRRLLELAPWQEEAHRQLMLLLALSGQRTQALAQYDRCTQLLMDELGVLPDKATDALYDQILAGEIGVPPVALAIPSTALVTPPPAALAPPFQVLTPPPHFVGRQSELACLRTGLISPGAPIYALVGMGGAGKTTLATQVAHQLRADFADGVLYANAATSDALDILASWAGAYGYDFSGLSDLASRGAAVRGLLADKAVLIVLDNVLEAEKVQPLLPSGDRTAVLLTTRDLDVASALNAQTLLLGELSAAHSRQLLAQILGEARVNAEESAAAQISALLHYLPLAVEIVAQRLKSRPRQPLAQMAERLAHEEHRLGLAISDRAVRASFAVSWAALDGALQRTFALLGLFAGRPFSAAAIARLAEEPVTVVEDRLYSLEALSLVRAEGTNYYRQHPLLADFAGEKLVDVVDPKVVNGRMAAYYLGFVQTNNQNYAMLEPEWANIMAAIQRAHGQGDGSVVIAFTDALAQTWLTRARYGEARQVYALAQAATLQSGDRSRQAVNLLRWGEVCLEQNDYAEAKTLLTDSLTLFYQVEADAGVANAQCHLATLALEQNHYDEAVALLATCLAIRQQLDDKAGIAAVLLKQARIDYDLDGFERAKALAEQALAIQQQVGDRQSLLPTLRMLAQIALMTKHHDRALDYCRQSRAMCEELQNQGELAATLYALTGIYNLRQQFEQAKVTATEAMALIQRLGLRKHEGMMHYQLALTYKGGGDLEAACTATLQSIEIFRVVDDELGCAYSFVLLGDLYATLGLFAESKSAWQSAQRSGQALNQPWLIEEMAKRLG